MDVTFSQSRRATVEAATTLEAMTVAASIILAAVVGGVIFVLLDSWQRRARPAPVIVEPELAALDARAGRAAEPLPPRRGATTAGPDPPAAVVGLGEPLSGQATARGDRRDVAVVGAAAAAEHVELRQRARAAPA